VIPFYFSLLLLFSRFFFLFVSSFSLYLKSFLHCLSSKIFFLSHRLFVFFVLFRGHLFSILSSFFLLFRGFFFYVVRLLIFIGDFLLGLQPPVVVRAKPPPVTSVLPTGRAGSSQVGVRGVVPFFL
jgi:hypothetical protein